MDHCGNVDGEWTPNKSWHRKLLWKRKLCCHSFRDSNPQPFSQLTILTPYVCLHVDPIYMSSVDPILMSSCWPHMCVHVDVYVCLHVDIKGLHFAAVSCSQLPSLHRKDSLWRKRTTTGCWWHGSSQKTNLLLICLRQGFCLDASWQAWKVQYCS